MFKVLGVSVFLCAACFAAPQQPSSTPSSVSSSSPQNIYFVVSAKGLDGNEKDTDGVADPFVKVFTGKEPRDVNGTSNSTALEPLDVSETIVNENNPSWNTVFMVKYEPNTNQLLYLEVRDHDPVNPDDTMGDAYIKLDDFVKKGTYTQVLEKAKAGSITVTRTTPIYFDLIVKDLPRKDEFNGLSDPYVKCYFRVGKEGKDYKFLETDPVDNSETASWEHVAFKNYQRGTNQVLHFRVKDKDTITGDDDLGEAFVDVDEFLAENRPKTFTLPENGILELRINRDL